MKHEAISEESHTTILFYSQETFLHLSCTSEINCSSGFNWLAFVSQQQNSRKERNDKKHIFRDNTLLWFVGFTCWGLWCWFWQVRCFKFFSPVKTADSQGVLSAPYCNTSRGDWQTNRWGCHMFVKESAKCSLQLTNSSDIFLPAIPPLSSCRCCSLHLGETHDSLMSL